MLRNLATTLSFIGWFFTTGIAGEVIAADCLSVQSIVAPFKNQLTSRLENEQQATRFVSGAETIVRSLEEKTSLTHSMAQDVESKTKSSKSKAWVSNKSVGHNHSTFDGVQVSAGGGFQVEGPKGVELDLPTNQKKHTSRDDFLNNSLHSYANVLMDREDVTVNDIYESYKKWDEKSRGPTAAAKVVIALIMAAVTAGAGAAIAGGMATAAGATGAGAAGAATGAAAAGGAAAASTGLIASITSNVMFIGALQAGVTTLATEATYAGMNYGTDAGKFLKHMTSTDMAKTVLMSMAQGGATIGVTQATGVNGIQTDFTRKLATNAVRNAVSSGFAVAQGADLKQTLMQSGLTIAANTMQDVGAGHIGERQSSGVTDYLQHKVEHFLAGAAAAGLANAGSKDWLEQAFTGGVAAAGSEIMVDAMSGFVRRGAQARINEEIRQKGEISDQQVKDIVHDEGRKIASVAKIMTASAAFAGGADVETAVTSADSALDNNWLQVGYYAVVGGLAVYTAYDIYDTYQTEGPEAALKKAGVEIALAATGGFIVKKGASLAGKAYPTAEALWAAYVETSPGMMAAGAKISQWAGSASTAAGKMVDAVGKARIGQAATKLEEGAARVKGKIVEKLNVKSKLSGGIGKKESTSLTESVVEDTKEMKILRGNDGKVKGVKYTQDHHIISDKNPLTMNHELWEKAGVDIQSRANKMLLPTKKGAALSTTERSVHDGKHLKDVNEHLADQMDVKLKYGIRNSWSQNQFKEALNKIISDERAMLKSGHRILNKNHREWAIPLNKKDK